MAVSNRYARATAWLACLSAILHLGPSEASRALLETTEGVATDAGVATAGWPEGFAPGLWLTSVVKTAPGYAELEGKTGMLFSHPGVAETLLYVSPEESPDEILAAALLTLVEGATREDGTAAVYLSTRATTDDPFAAVFASDRCLSVSLADRDGEETAHVLVKANATSLDDCPSPPVPSDFDDDGAALDLQTLGADGAVLARRPGADLAATWPDDIPGAWTGSILSATKLGDVDPGVPATVYFSAHQGYAPNAWLFIDPDDPTRVTTANVGRFAGTAEASGGGPAWRNDAYKGIPGTVGVSGSVAWCNAMVVSGDAAVNFSNDADAEDGAEATCPKSPRAEMFEGELDEDLLEENGAATMESMRRLG